MATIVQTKSAYSTGATSRTIVFDSAPTEGNLLLFIVGIGRTTSTPVSDWTLGNGLVSLIYDNPAFSGAVDDAFAFHVAGKYAEASEDNSYTIGTTGTTTNFSLLAFEVSGDWPAQITNLIGSYGTSGSMNSARVDFAGIPVAVGELCIAAANHRYTVGVDEWDGSFATLGVDTDRVKAASKVSAASVEGTALIGDANPANQRIRGLLFSLSETDSPVTVEVDTSSAYIAGQPVVLRVTGIIAAYTITAAGQAATVTGDDLDPDGRGTITFTGIRGDYRYGASVPIVLTMGGNDYLTDAALAAEAGKDWVNLVAPLATSGERLTAIPDLAPGDQVAWYSVTGGTIADVEVLSDGSINGAESVTGFMVEHHNGLGWGTPALQSVSRPAKNITSTTWQLAVADGRWDSRFPDGPPVEPPPPAEFAHGEVVELTPAMFGLSSFAADPVMQICDRVVNQAAYDDLGDGEIVPVTAGYPWRRNTTWGNKVRIERGETHARHQFDGARYRIDGKSYLGLPEGFGYNTNAGRGLYVEWWLRFDEPMDNTGSNKVIRVWGSGSGTQRYLSWTNSQASPFMGSNNGSWIPAVRNNIKQQQWNLMQMWCERPDLTDATTWRIVLATNNVFIDQAYANADPSPYDDWGLWADPIVSLVGWDASIADAYRNGRFGDIYAAGGAQRFVISDSVTPGWSSVTEAQEIVSWSPSSVSIRVFQGAHSSLIGRHILYYNAANVIEGTPIQISEGE